MAFIKEYIRKNLVALLVMLGACVFSVIAFVLYQKSFDTRFAVISNQVVTMYLVGMIVAFVSLVVPGKEPKLIAAAFLLYGCLAGAASQGNYIVNVLVAIDGNTFSGGFIFGTIASFICWIAAIVAFALDKYSVFDISFKKEEKTHEETN